MAAWGHKWTGLVQLTPQCCRLSCKQKTEDVSDDGYGARDPAEEEEPRCVQALLGTDHAVMHMTATHAATGTCRQERWRRDMFPGERTGRGAGDWRARGETGRTAFALAEEQELDDLPLLPEGALALDVLVYLV